MFRGFFLTGALKLEKDCDKIVGLFINGSKDLN